jgi:hypothetical protein
MRVARAISGHKNVPHRRMQSGIIKSEKCVAKSSTDSYRSAQGIFDANWNIRVSQSLVAIAVRRQAHWELNLNPMASVTARLLD